MERKIPVKAGTEVIYVSTDQYPTIQEAINHANSGDTIFVRKGTYYEHVVVNKSVSLVGEDRDSTIVDGNGIGKVISITANNVSIEGLTIRGSGMGPYDCGIFVDHSTGNHISHSKIENNCDGISLYYGSSNVVSGNTITKNDYGISLYSSSGNMFSGNIISSNYNYGIFIYGSNNNTIYCNNFNNTYQVWSDTTSMNVWDDGDEGNYWSDYTGQDLNADGIGDTLIPHQEVDNYPLMGMFSDFSFIHREEMYHVTTICNSTISEFRFEIGTETGNKIIRFNVTGKDSTVGFCRVRIPTALMNYPYIVLVGVEEIVPTLLDVSNETYVYLYFTYIHSGHTITIISSKMLIFYNELLEEYVRLQIDLYDLNGTYYGLLNNYSILLGNYSQLQKSYHELNSSYQDHLLDYSKNVHNFRNLTYIFAATTAIFIITTIYLSKRAHAGKTKVFEDNKC